MITALVEPSVCTYAEADVQTSSTKIYWHDPGDTVIENQVVCTWRGTKLVGKKGSYPTSPTDGTVLVDNTVANKYDFTPFNHNVASSENWYYTLFPYSAHGKYSLNTKNRVAKKTADPTTNFLKLYINAPAGWNITIPIGPFLSTTTSQITVDWGDRFRQTTNGPNHTYRDGNRSYVITITSTSSNIGWGFMNPGAMPDNSTSKTNLQKFLTKVEVQGTCPISYWAHNSFALFTKLQEIVNPNNLFNSVKATTATVTKAATNSTDGNYRGEILCSDAINFEKFYYNCYSLKQLYFRTSPLSSLIKNKTYLSINFTDMFTGCIAATTTNIDTTDFITSSVNLKTDSNGAYGQLSLTRMFRNCTGLTEMPNGWQNYPATTPVLDCDGMFYRCTGITKIQSTWPLFFAWYNNRSGNSYAKYTLNARLMFYGCTGLLTVDCGSTNILGDGYTRGPLNSTKTNLGFMFFNCSKLTSLPTLWNNYNSTYYNGCFLGCTTASNYGSAPDAWKKNNINWVE